MRHLVFMREGPVGQQFRMLRKRKAAGNEGGIAGLAGFEYFPERRGSQEAVDGETIRIFAQLRAVFEFVGLSVRLKAAAGDSVGPGGEEGNSVHAGQVVRSPIQDFLPVDLHADCAVAERWRDGDFGFGPGVPQINDRYAC